MEAQGGARAEGARTFLTSGDAYDAFMGRYSRPLAVAFLDAVGVTAGQRALDVDESRQRSVLVALKGQQVPEHLFHYL